MSFKNRSIGVGVRRVHWALAFGAALLLSCNGRTRSEKDQGKPSLSGDGHVAIVDLSAGATEGGSTDGLFAAPTGQSFTHLIRNLSDAQGDKKIRAIFLRLRGQTLPFYQSKEIAEQLIEFKKRDLPVVCHTHEIDNSVLWLVSQACSETWISAAGGVATVGIGAELSYLKGAFDKAGIQADMLAMGKYKSGGEALTRSEPGEDSLRNLQDTLGDLRSQWLVGVSEGAKDPQQRKQQAEDGPWSPKRAQEIGLVQHVGFEDQALAAAKAQGGTEATETLFGDRPSGKEATPVAEIVRLLAGGGARKERKKRIAVVPALGQITMDATGPFGGSEGITAAALTRTLKRLRKDDAVKAVVLRMDSPGGSPLASDLIWREMMLLREEKPVIVSIASMSASGGYYIASGATKIVSSSTAIVGSIGVFGGKIVLGGALAKLGVTSFSVGASPHEGAAARATYMSPMSPWDDATREKVRGTMRRIYDLFVERVAEGRGMDKEKVYATAEGEIYLATTGKERGLIDELGGIQKAIAIAKEEGDLPDDIAVVIEGGPESILEALFLGPEPEAKEVEAALARFEAQRLKAASDWALGGIADDLKPFRAALAPLLAGEVVVAALPYAITIR